jgi:uncharacterized protein YxjI
MSNYFKILNASAVPIFNVDDLGLYVRNGVDMKDASSIKTMPITEKTKTISLDYTIDSDNNAISIGTTTISSGVTVTIPVNSSWVII